MEIHNFFAQLAWFSFVLVMVVRPLANVYPNKYILFLLRRRRLIGIVCGYSAVLHIFIYFLGGSVLSVYFTNFGYWSYKGLYLWGSIAFILMLFPFLTSNKFSQILLGQKWKKIQRFSYPAFVFAGIHISFAKGEWGIGFLPLIIWLTLLFWAEKKIKEQTRK